MTIASNTAVEETPRSWAARFSLYLWLAVALSVLASFLFWRMGYVRPHATWAILSLATIGISLAGLVIVVLCRLVRGKGRLRAVGWLLIGLTPLVWSGAYLTDLSIRADTREAVAFSTPVRVVATWVSSVMDAEARWKYPRWVYGQHTVLLDQGETPNAEGLVDEMDEHIRSMAKLLGQPVPKSEFPWVRGSLVGQNRRAILSWALCGQEDNPAELTYLDRHEVAHTLITLMGSVDQYPPCVLIEGWAESQSVDRSKMIRALSERHQDGMRWPRLDGRVTL